MPGRYFIETYGCQMNVRDSETMAGELEALGFLPAPDASGADVIVLNTCSVRERPHHKVFSRLGELARLKRNRPDLVLAVAGCMAQIVGDRIAERSPYVDIILGPRNLGRFGASIAEVLADRGPSTGLGTSGHILVRDTAECLPEGLAVHRAPGLSAFVNVTYGCNNFCAYCVVPYARGREVSRPPADILAEIEAAVAQGYREVTLLGQNVNSYGADLEDGTDFADLLAMVDAVAGLWRVRFTTSHPRDCSEKLLRAMAGLPTVCEHLHLPLQAGSDDVLRRMGRGYSFADYSRTIALARQLMPDLAVTTDLMVGFPGETEADFEATLAAVREIRFDQAFMFKYDDRPGTRAADMPDKLAEKEKLARLAILIDLQNTLAREVNAERSGQSFEVLVEGPDQRHGDLLRGRTRQNKTMIFAGDPGLVGELVSVRATEAFMWGFLGELA